MEIVGGIVKLLNDTVNNVLIPVFGLLTKYWAKQLLGLFSLQGVASAIVAAKAVVEAVKVMANALSTLINSTPVGLFAKSLVLI